MQRWSDELGFNYQPEELGPFEILKMPFRYGVWSFNRFVDNACSGTWKDRSFVLYDLHQGDDAASSCVILGVPLWCPDLLVAPSSVPYRLADELGAQQIEFESIEFNERFQVRCDDSRFAHTVIDGRMMELLMRLDTPPQRRYVFEFAGSWLLCMTGMLDTTDLPDAGVAVLDRIPDLVYDLYPPPPVEAE